MELLNKPKVYVCAYTGPVKIKEKKDCFKWLSHQGIRYVTMGDSSHVECMINNVFYSSSSLDKGVRAKSMLIDSHAWVVYETNRSAAHALAVFNRYRNADYDYCGIAGFLHPWVNETGTKLLCSEIVSEMIDMPSPYHKNSPHTVEKWCIDMGFKRYGTLPEIQALQTSISLGVSI